MQEKRNEGKKDKKKKERGNEERNMSGKRWKGGVKVKRTE